MTVINCSPIDYVQQLKACIAACDVIDPDDRVLPHKRNDNGTLWMLGRGMVVGEMESFRQERAGAAPFALTRGGTFHMYIKLESDATRSATVNVTGYSMCFAELRQNDNSILSIRCDGDGRINPPRGKDWVEALNDNPFHARFHNHINFHDSWFANEFRWPVGFVNPIVTVQFFSYWYGTLCNRGDE